MAVRNAGGCIVAVLQLLNKNGGTEPFNRQDEELLQAIRHARLS